MQQKDNSEQISTKWERKNKNNKKDKNIKIPEKHHLLIDPLSSCHPKSQKQCINQDKNKWLQDKDKSSWDHPAAAEVSKKQYLQECVNPETI